MHHTQIIMKTVQKTSLAALFLLGTLTLSTAGFAQAVTVGDTLKMSDVRANYVTLRIIPIKMGLQFYAHVDFGQPAKDYRFFPELRIGKEKVVSITKTRFINIMDEEGFDFVREDTSEGTENLLFRRRRN